MLAASFCSRLENAMDARRQRIILSRSSVNWLKWACLFVQAGYYRDANLCNRAAVLALLIASHDRSFTGEISIKPDVLLQVRPE
jgi:hypothetical protein